MRVVCRSSFLVLMLVLARPVDAFADFARIRDLIRRGDFAAALRACEQDLQLRPRDHQIWTLKGVALQGLNRNPESLAAFRHALTIRPQFLPALQGAAQLEYQARDARARHTLETILKVRPDPIVHAMLGALAFEREDCSVAVEHYEKAGATAGAEPIVKWQLGACYYQLEQWDAAAAQFGELLKIRDDEGVRYNLGLVQLNAKKPSDAVATLQPLGQRERPAADALSLLASAYEANGQTPEAVELLRRAIEMYPREERLYADLAAICLEHSSFALGTEILEVGAKNLPRSAGMQTMLGVMHASGGFVEKAEAAFRKAEQLAPDAQHGHVGLAVSLMQRGAAEGAVRVLREQAARTPNDALVSVTLAEALLQKDAAPEQLHEAQLLLNRVVKQQPANARAHSMLGKIYFRLKDTSNAVRSLEAAIRLDPTDGAATYQLMTLYHRAGRKQEAETLRVKAQKLREANASGETESGRYRLVRVPDNRPAP